GQLPGVARADPPDRQGGRVALLEVHDLDRIPARLIDSDVDPVGRRIRVHAGVFVDELTADLQPHAIVGRDVEAKDARLLEANEPRDDGANALPGFAREHDTGAHVPVEVHDGRSALELASLHLRDVVHDGVRILDRQARFQLVRRRLGLGRAEAHHRGRDSRPHEDSDREARANRVEDPWQHGVSSVVPRGWTPRAALQRCPYFHRRVRIKTTITTSVIAASTTRETGSGSPAWQPSSLTTKATIAVVPGFMTRS